MSSTFRRNSRRTSDASGTTSDSTAGPITNISEYRKKLSDKRFHYESRTYFLAIACAILFTVNVATLFFGDDGGCIAHFTRPTATYNTTADGYIMESGETSDFMITTTGDMPQNFNLTLLIVLGVLLSFSAVQASFFINYRALNRKATGLLGMPIAQLDPEKNNIDQVYLSKVNEERAEHVADFVTNTALMLSMPFVALSNRYLLGGDDLDSGLGTFGLVFGWYLVMGFVELEDDLNKTRARVTAAAAKQALLTTKAEEVREKVYARKTNQGVTELAAFVGLVAQTHAMMSSFLSVLGPFVVLGIIFTMFAHPLGENLANVPYEIVVCTGLNMALLSSSAIMFVVSKMSTKSNWSTIYHLRNINGVAVAGLIAAYSFMATYTLKGKRLC